MAKSEPQNKEKVWIILVAGGAGVRFGAPKQFADLLNQPVMEWSLKTAKSVTSNLVLVLPADNSEEDFQKCQGCYVTTGGKTRSASVRAGLKKIQSMGDLGSGEIVLIHDAVRPLAKKDLFTKTIQAIQAGADAAVPTIPITDTIHSKEGEIIDRSQLLSLQTPQAFRAEVIMQIHKTEPEATDDISLCILGNHKVEYIEGDPQNLKITEPHDLEIAKALLGEA